MTLQSTAYGLTWHFWCRNRRGLCAVAAYLMGMGLLLHSGFASGLHRSEGFLVGGIVLPVFAFILYLVGISINAAADVADTRSGYPAYLMALPVRTEQLALWPMVCGTAGIALFWMLAVLVVLAPIGLPPEFRWWPAMTLAAILACLQALFWSPIGIPYLRVVVAVLLVPILLTVVNQRLENGTPVEELSAGLAGLIVLVYGVSVAGLALARRGDGASWRFLRIARWESGDSELLPQFRSAAAAQLWFERRSHGFTAALVTGAACLLLSLPMLLIRDTGFAFPSRGPLASLASVEPNLCLQTILIPCAVFPIWAAAIGGGGLRKPSSRRGDLSMSSFVGARPVGSAELVLAKFRMAGLSAGMAWGTFLMVALLWMLTPAVDGGRSGLLGLLLIPHCTARVVGWVASALVLAVFGTWRAQVVGMWVELTGRAWIVNLAPVAYVLLAVAAISWHPGGPYPAGSRWSALLRVAHEGAWIAAALKLLLGAWSMERVVRRGMLAGSTLIRLLGVWLAAVAALFWLLDAGPFADTWFAILPPGWRTAGTTALIAFLFVPFVRLAVAPFALEWNRHR